jgi:hypothetical protein
MPPALALSVVIIFILGVAVSAMQLGRLLQARMIHRSLREAMGKDRELAETLAVKLDFVGRRDERRGDDRAGMVLIAIGLATAGFALIQNDASMRTIFGAALFPFLVGAALLLRDVMIRRNAAKKHVGGA